MLTVIEVARFLNGPHKNAWIETPELKVYVRKAIRKLGLDYTTCFDVANLQVTVPRKGTGTKFLQEIEAHIIANHPELEHMYIESVLTADMHRLARKLGYTRIALPWSSPEELTPNYYKCV